MPRNSNTLRSRLLWFGLGIITVLAYQNIQLKELIAADSTTAEKDSKESAVIVVQDDDLPESPPPSGTVIKLVKYHAGIISMGPKPEDSMSGYSDPFKTAPIFWAFTGGSRSLFEDFKPSSIAEIHTMLQQKIDVQANKKISTAEALEKATGRRLVLLNEYTPEYFSKKGDEEYGFDYNLYKKKSFLWNATKLSLPLTALMKEELGRYEETLSVANTLSMLFFISFDYSPYYKSLKTKAKTAARNKQWEKKWPGITTKVEYIVDKTGASKTNESTSAFETPLRYIITKDYIFFFHVPLSPNYKPDEAFGPC